MQQKRKVALPLIATAAISMMLLAAIWPTPAEAGTLPTDGSTTPQMGYGYTGSGGGCAVDYIDFRTPICPGSIGYGSSSSVQNVYWPYSWWYPTYASYYPWYSQYAWYAQYPSYSWYSSYPWYPSYYYGYPY
jgi:hypothetical protein